MIGWRLVSRLACDEAEVGIAVDDFFTCALFANASAIAQGRYWQCARFAREFSGIDIRGDAWTWWLHADGRYARGDRPRIGAVMYFTPTARTPLGHVATVTRIVSPRVVTITHLNWSPIDGTRGQIERDVLVRDVSGADDWARVSVWHAPLGDLGTTAWPVGGFIYPGGSQSAPSALPTLAATIPVRKSAPRLAYARLDALDRRLHPRLLGADIVRMAMRESRRGRAAPVD